MQIQEVSDKKRMLEHEITQSVSSLIKKFTDETGVAVDSVSVSFVEAHPMGGIPCYHAVSSEVSVKI